jgi:hypothetical protein
MKPVSPLQGKHGSGWMTMKVSRIAPYIDRNYRKY